MDHFGKLKNIILTKNWIDLKKKVFQENNVIMNSLWPLLALARKSYIYL